MPLTENLIRLTATGACLSNVPPKNCDMFAVFISVIRNCNGFKVRITKYQLRKQIGVVLNESRQYNMLGFDLIMPSHPKSFPETFWVRGPKQGLVKHTVFSSPLRF